MTTRHVTSGDPRVPLSTRIPGAVTTVLVLLGLWAGFHWYDPPSWAVGIPMALIGGALSLCLPASKSLRLSPRGAVWFILFAIKGILFGAIDVSRCSLFPRTITPGYMPWRTYLPDGRPRQLFAVAITLLPGTLTARIEGDLLTVHALDLSDATGKDLAELEDRIAGLYKIERKEMSQ